MVDVPELHTTEEALEASVSTGLWAGAPSTAATGVDMLNDSGYLAVVEVTGGTVTAVKLDGVTVGSRTSGGFMVRNGGKIQWTGSGAPTLQWRLLPV